MTRKIRKLEHTQTNTPNHLHTFYPRVTNNINIQFNSTELTLLNKGLKYNLPYKHKNWVKTLALEAETAISQLSTHEQDYVRALKAHNLKKLYKYKHTFNSNQPPQEYRILKQIKKKKKLHRHTAIITKADKSNSIVVLYSKDYHNKVQNFIDNNNFTILKKDPTNSFQNKVKTTIKLCHSILPQHSNKNF
jgi:ATP-dependent Lon protease